MPPGGDGELWVPIISSNSVCKRKTQKMFPKACSELRHRLGLGRAPDKWQTLSMNSSPFPKERRKGRRERDLRTGKETQNWVNDNSDNKTKYVQIRTVAIPTQPS